ncbi:MAG: hypothetical protein NVSMB17_00750 [Candidatus Dormibacteria bacterium]
MRMGVRKSSLAVLLAGGMLAMLVGTAPAVLGSPGPVTVGVGGAGPASATFSGGPISGNGDGGGLLGAPTPCNAASSCEAVTIHLAAPAGFTAGNDITLTTTVTFTGAGGVLGLDTFLLDSKGKELGHDTSGNSPSKITAGKLAPGDYTLDVVGDTGTATTYDGKVEASSAPRVAAKTASGLPADIAFAPSTVVSPILLGGEPQMSYERPQANSVAGRVDARRGFVDWPISSRTGVGTLWRTVNGGESYRQLVDSTCAPRQRPNCFTSGGGDTVNRVNNYDGNLLFGDQEALAAEAYAQSNDHGDSFPIQTQQAITAAGTGVDRQWISAVDAPGLMAGPIDKFEMEGMFSYHIPGQGQYVSGIDKNGITHPALITTITDVGQSGPSRIDTTGGPGNGYFYQSYRGFLLTSGSMVAAVPLSQYQDPTKYAIHKYTPEAAVVFPWINLDTAGNLYAIWTSPVDNNIYMTYSLIRDRANDPTRGGVPATKWSPRVKINPPPLTSVIFPEIIAGDPGHVAITYMGSPDYSGSSSTAPVTARWWSWVTTTTNALDASPTWRTGPVSHRVAHVGPICTNGTTCVGQQDRSLLDMIDVSMDAEGRPAVVYPNNNNTYAVQMTSLSQQGSPYIYTSKMTQGPSLLNGKPDFNITYPTQSRDAKRDDATWPNTASGTQLPALDVLQASVTADGKDVVATVKLAEGTAAAITRDIGAYNAARGNDIPADRAQFVVRFETAKDVWYMGLEQDTTGAQSAYGGKVDASNAILNGTSSVGTNYNAQAGYAVKFSLSGNFLTLRAPMAQFGLAPGSTLYSFTAFSMTSPSHQSLGAANQDGTLLTIPRVIDASYPMDAVLGAATTNPQNPGGGGGGGGGRPVSGSDSQLPNTSGAPGVVLPMAIVAGAALLVVGARRRRRRGPSS